MELPAQLRRAAEQAPCLAAPHLGELRGHRALAAHEAQRGDEPTEEIRRAADDPLREPGTDDRVPRGRRRPGWRDASGEREGCGLEVRARAVEERHETRGVRTARARRVLAYDGSRHLGTQRVAAREEAARGPER